MALTLVHVSVEDAPLMTAVGAAAMETVGSGGPTGGETVTVTDCEALPPAPVQVSRYAAVAVSPVSGSDPASALAPVQPPLATQLVA